MAKKITTNNTNEKIEEVEIKGKTYIFSDGFKVGSRVVDLDGNGIGRVQFMYNNKLIFVNKDSVIHIIM